MTTPRRPLLLLASLLCAAPALASQDSERLVGQAEVAYQARHYDDAVALYQRAADADPKDPAAQYGLGLALGKVGRWSDAAAAFERALALRPDFAEAQVGRDLALAHATSGSPSALEPEHRVVGTTDVERALPTEEAPVRRPWGLHASVGVQYDSNVTIEPRGHKVGTGSNRGDAAFVFGAGGRYDILDHPDFLLRFEYDFYQTVHPRIDRFDFQSHRARLTGGYALAPWLWAGAQAGYEYYLLGGDSYLSEPYVTPFVSFLEGTWGLTQASYRHGDDTYLSKPFHDLRDGPVDTASLVQTFYDGPRYLTLGYELGFEHPTHGSRVPTGDPTTLPSDYDLISNQAHVGVGFPAWFRTNVDLMYLFRYEDYTRPNSRATDPNNHSIGFLKTRQDSGHHMYASLSRPITDVLSVAFSYYGTVNLSNLPVFDYRRNVAGVTLQVAF